MFMDPPTIPFIHKGYLRVFFSLLSLRVTFLFVFFVVPGISLYLFFALFSLIICALVDLAANYIVVALYVFYIQQFYNFTSYLCLI